MWINQLITDHLFHCYSFKRQIPVQCPDAISFLNIIKVIHSLPNVPCKAELPRLTVYSLTTRSLGIFVAFAEFFSLYNILIQIWLHSEGDIHAFHSDSYFLLINPLIVLH